jgi:hypothetical protein
MPDEGKPAQRQLGGVNSDNRAGGRFVREHSTPIYVGRQVVGHVLGDTFRKTVHSERHLLEKPRAWCFDIQSLRDAEAVGARCVELQDQDTDQTYMASIARIWELGFELDRGHGHQIGLILEQWEIERPNAPRQLAFAFGGAP